MRRAGGSALVLQLLAMILLGLGLPAALALAGGTTWHWLGAGAAAWAVAVAIKAGLNPTIASATARWGDRGKAAAAGVWSGVCELGAVAVLLLRADDWPTLADVVGLGVGAGSFEVLFVTWIGTVGERSEDGEQFPLRDRLLWLGWPAVLERFLSCISHLTTRGLVWIGLTGWHLTPAWLLALVSFAGVDGLATYGHEKEWDWTDPRVLRRFYTVLAIAAAIEAVVFLALVLILQTLS